MIMKIKNMDYLVTQAVRFEQNKITYYMFSLDVYDLIKICAFKPAEYNKIDDEYTEINLEESEIDINNLIKDNKDEDFNRHLDKNKLTLIKKYVEEKDDFSFPNSVILSGYDKNSILSDEFMSKSIDQHIKDNDNLLDEFNSYNGIFFDDFTNKVYIPLIKNSLLIVYGQHRIAGLTKLDEEKQKKIFLPINLVIGQVNAVLSNMFYTINATQKPVNPSVLEYMTNLFLQNVSESKMFQEYIRLLNDNKKSPLFKQIKMFGTGEGLIAFAPLHKALMDITLETTTRSKKIPILRALFENEDKRYIILNLIVYYFKAIKELFYNNQTQNWDFETPYTKTIGLVLLLNIFPRILLKILDERNNTNLLELENITDNDFFKILINIQSIDVSPYLKGSSMGMVKRLKEETISTLNLNSYDEKFVNNIHWISKYKK